MVRHRKSTRRNRRRKTNSYGPLAGVSALALVVLGAGGYGLSVAMNTENMGADYCYDREDQVKAAILVDNSLGNLSDAHLRDYRKVMMDAYAAAPANTHVQIYTTANGRNSSLGDLAYSQCKPASTIAEQRNIGAPETTNPWHARKAGEAEAAYQAALDRILTEVQDTDQQAGDSPILEQLQAISMRPEFQGRDRRLTVISDLIQNSETARFCTHQGHMPSFATFQTRPAYRFVEPQSFAGTQVTLAYVDQNLKLPYCTQPELIGWYGDFFKGNDAISVRTIRLRSWAK